MRRGLGEARRVLERERERVVRLRDEAAIHEEHGHPDAPELREEACLRFSVLSMMERRLGRRL